MAQQILAVIGALEAFRELMPEILGDAARHGGEKAVAYLEGVTPEAGEQPFGASGAMKSHWRMDSDLEPQPIPDGVQITIRNAVPYPVGRKEPPAYAEGSYASFAIEGHEMDVHFVEKLGVVVGTQTPAVLGIEGGTAERNIMDDAWDVFSQSVREELAERAAEVGW
jgi:hypothetical protein